VEPVDMEYQLYLQKKKIKLTVLKDLKKLHWDFISLQLEWLSWRQQTINADEDAGKWKPPYTTGRNVNQHGDLSKNKNQKNLRMEFLNGS
jgi:hypothetical protein